MSYFPPPKDALDRTQQAWARTHLVARYGVSRANRIIAGQDGDANRDLAKWRNLGKPKGERT